MPRKSGGAQQLRRGDRVRINNGCFRHYLKGLEGVVTCVYWHGVAVALDNDPQHLQKVIAVGGQAGPKNPTVPQRMFQFNEVEKVNP